MQINSLSYDFVRFVYYPPYNNSNRHVKHNKIKELILTCLDGGFSDFFP